MEPKTLAEACKLLSLGMRKPDTTERNLQKLKDELTSDSSDVKILKPNIPLKSCVGLEEIKKDILTFLDKAISAEATEPVTNDRILLFGDIGTGKTHLIQGIATELKASIIRPGTYFFLYQWLLDRGINYTKALYQICEENGPVTVLFLQNLDLLCGGDERRRTMNRFIRTLQYFWNLIGQENPNKPPNRLVIFATTTWPDGLDEQMILGFGKRMYIPTLNFQERKLLETLIQQNLELGHVMNPKEMNWIARMTYGISILEAKYKVQDAICCQSFEWIEKQKMLEKSFPEGDRVVVPYVRRPLEVNDFVEAFRRVIVLDSKRWSMYEAFQMKFGNGPFMKIHERKGGEDSSEEDDDGQEDEVGQKQKEKVEKKKKNNGLMWMAFSWL